ncbi:hypothetical protein BJ508DRAFT_413018, partial [Ascobolus immersus RN42]
MSGLSSLPNEVLLEVGEHVLFRYGSTPISNLRLVNKRFARIFWPLLFHTIHLTTKKLQQLADLTSIEGLELVKEWLHNVHVFRFLARGKAITLNFKVDQEREEIPWPGFSYQIVDLLGAMEATLQSFQWHSDIPLPAEALKKVRKFRYLQHFDIGPGPAPLVKCPSRGMSGLHSLKLDGLSDPDMKATNTRTKLQEDLVGTLLACPDLKELKLGWRLNREAVFFDGEAGSVSLCYLRELCALFSERSEERGIGRLRLEILILGRGCYLSKAEDSDHLAIENLTDLHYLKSLDLSAQAARYDGLYERAIGQLLPFLIPSVFPALRRLTFATYTHVKALLNGVSLQEENYPAHFLSEIVYTSAQDGRYSYRYYEESSHTVFESRRDNWPSAVVHIMAPISKLELQRTIEVYSQVEKLHLPNFRRTTFTRATTAPTVRQYRNNSSLQVEKDEGLSDIWPDFVRNLRRYHRLEQLHISAIPLITTTLKFPPTSGPRFIADLHGKFGSIQELYRDLAIKVPILSNRTREISRGYAMHAFLLCKTLRYIMIENYLWYCPIENRPHLNSENRYDMKIISAFDESIEWIQDSAIRARPELELFCVEAIRNSEELKKEEGCSI